MRMSKLVAVAAASSLFATPVLANAASPLSLSNVSSVKASTSAKKSNKAAPAVLIGVVAVAAVAGGIVAATTGNSASK